MEHVGPLLRALRHLVELPLDLSRVANFDKLIAETPLEEAGHCLADRCGLEAAVLLGHVAAVLDHVDDAGVGGGTADPLLLHLFDERGFGEPRRRRLKLLPRLDVEGRKHRPLGEVREHLVAVVPRRAADPIETVEPQHAAVGLEDGARVAVAPLHADARRIPFGVGRLAGHEALPDQPVELELLVTERGGDAVGLPGGVGRPDRLVGLLGALVGARIHPRLLGHVGRSMPLLEVAAGHVDRLAREVRGVGSHVGDQAHAAFVGQVDALVELLGDPHRAVSRHAEAARGGLLQGARNERRIGLRPRPRDIDRLHRVARLWIRPAGESDDVFAASFARFVGLPDHGDVEQAGRLGGGTDVAGEVGRRRFLRLDLHRLPANLHEVAGERAVIGEPGHPVAHQRRTAAFVTLRHEGRPLVVEAGRIRHVKRHASGDLPRFRRCELADLQLAIDHDPGGHALHAACREAAGHLLPEDR